MSFLRRPRRCNQDFVAYHEGDWRERNSAERLLEALRANIHTWQNKIMQQNRMESRACEDVRQRYDLHVADFRQPHLADQVAGDMDRLMKVIRLHSGQGNSNSVLDENQAVESNRQEIQTPRQFIAGELKCGAFGLCLNGWRLVAPPRT